MKGPLNFDEAFDVLPENPNIHGCRFESFNSFTRLLAFESAWDA